MASYIERRKFLATLLGGAAIAWPLAARAQQAGKIRKIGWLSPGSPVVELGTALNDALRELGWIEGKNVTFEYRRADPCHVHQSTSHTQRRRSVDPLA